MTGNDAPDLGQRLLLISLSPQRDSQTAMAPRLRKSAQVNELQSLHPEAGADDERRNVSREQRALEHPPMNGFPPALPPLHLGISRQTVLEEDQLPSAFQNPLYTGGRAAQKVDQTPLGK